MTIHTIPARLRAGFAAILLPALLALPFPALAGAVEKATGVWAVDVAASLDIPGLDRRTIYSPRQIEEATARAAGIRILMDLPAKTLTVREGEAKARVLPLESIVEKNGAVVLRLGGEEPDEIFVTPLSAGRVRVGSPFNIILVKVAKVPPPAATSPGSP